MSATRVLALVLACAVAVGAVPARADEPISDRERDHALMITGWAVAAVGVVGFAVLGSLTLAEDAALTRECGTHCTPARASVLDTYAIGADVSAATALAGAVIGAVFTVLWGVDVSAELFVRPMLPMGQRGPGGLGLALAGRF
jgi:hypothetical protein